MTTNKYTFNLEAKDCDISMISMGETKTIRIERIVDTELPFTLVMNTVGTDNSENIQRFKNAIVTVDIVADPY